MERWRVLRLASLVLLFLSSCAVYEPAGGYSYENYGYWPGYYYPWGAPAYGSFGLFYGSGWGHPWHHHHGHFHHGHFHGGGGHNGGQHH